MSWRSLSKRFLIIAIVSVWGVTQTAHASEDLILDGTISSGQGAANYTFSQSYPTGTTAADATRNSLMRRAIEAYKTFLPTVATEAVLRQMTSAGAVPNKVGINMDQGPMQQFAATNSDTPYNFIILDLRDGPMVVDMPENNLLLGLSNDHNMRWIENLGGIGPDEGKGGKYLYLPPGYEGDVPDGFYPAPSETWMVVVPIRSVPLDGDGAKAIAAAQEIKAYPLGSDRETTDWRWIDATSQRLPLPLLDWEGRLEFWRALHDVIQYETVMDEDRFTMGALEQLGIKVGEPFAPDEEMTALLSQAAMTAHAELSTVFYANTSPERLLWEDRLWELIPLTTMHLPKGDFGTASVSAREAADQFFFYGWGTSSTVGVLRPGVGNIFLLAFKDAGENYLDGAKSYQLTVPGPVPHGLFWSVTVYDADTRVLIETPQNRAAVRWHRDNPVENADGSYDIYFGPEKPKDAPESNWVQTIPGRGWFTAMRLYNPSDELFDRRWILNDIEVTE